MRPRTPDKSADEERLLPDVIERERGKSRLRPWLVLSMALNVVLGISVASMCVLSIRQPRRTSIPDEIYSPAHSAVEYETVVFTGGLHGDKSEYQGWSDEVNARWEALYNGMTAPSCPPAALGANLWLSSLPLDIGISQIPASAAARLPNATTPVAGDAAQFMVELDVFHQLHCLNLLRKLSYPDVFPLDLTSGSEAARDNVYHMEHCYDQLRQSIQCSSDISTIYWEWSVEKSKMFGNLRTTHTCRNFAKIREWAVEHRLREDFDWFKKVQGAPIRHSE